MKRYLFVIAVIFSQTLIGQVWNPPKQTVEVKHYVIDIQLDEKDAKVSGNVTYTLQPLWDGVKNITLKAEEMTIQSVLLGKETLAYKLKETTLHISLNRAYSREETLSISIHYEAHPRRGIYFVRPDSSYPNKPYQIWTQGEPEENHYWFPCYDYPNQLSTGEMKATVRKPYIAISNGKLQKVTETQEGWRTFHWQSSVPHVSYLVSIIVGDFVEIADNFDGIPLQYYVQKKDTANALRSFQKTPEMLRYFSKITAVKYAYEKYAQTPVEDFMWGGMENVSASTYTQNTIHDERAHLNWSSESLVAHELAHQWWGDLLTCRDWSQIWLNEGFATYYTVLWLEHDMGINQAKEELMGQYEWYIGDSNRHPIVWKDFGYNDDVFDSHAYAKGGWVLHMLRNTVGHENFLCATQLYLRRHQGKAVTTIDLQNAFEDTIGENLDWFFGQWVYGIGHPKFEVNWKWQKKHNMIVIHVKQTQKENPFRVTMPIEVVTDKNKTLYHVELDGQEQRIYLPSTDMPLYIAFDKDNTVLKEAEMNQSQEQWIAQLEKDTDICGQISAANALAKYPSKKAIAALSTALLGNNFYGVKTRIAALLGNINSSAVVDTLLLAIEDSDARVRAAVVTALGETSSDRDQEVVTILENLFNNDLSYRVQANAIKSLVNFAEEESEVLSFKSMKVLLKKALKTDSHLNVVRRAAISVYSDIDEDGALAVLETWYAYGQPAECRNEALSAFFEHNKSEVDDTLEVLLPLLNDKDHSIRSTVVELLQELASKKAIPALIEVEENDDLLSIQNSAKNAIKKIQGK